LHINIISKLFIYGILRQPKVTISFSSSSRGEEADILFKRKGGGSVSSRGEEADLLFKRRGRGSSLQEERKLISPRGREVGRLFKRKGGGSSLQEEGRRIVTLG